MESFIPRHRYHAMKATVHEHERVYVRLPALVGIDLAICGRCSSVACAPTPVLVAPVARIAIVLSVSVAALETRAVRLVFVSVPVLSVDLSGYAWLPLPAEDTHITAEAATTPLAQATDLRPYPVLCVVGVVGGMVRGVVVLSVSAFL